MKGRDKRNFLFWLLMLCFYFISIWFSYDRVYIKHNYPIFYTEDEVPDPLAPINRILNMNILI